MSDVRIDREVLNELLGAADSWLNELNEYIISGALGEDVEEYEEGARALTEAIRAAWRALDNEEAGR